MAVANYVDEHGSYPPPFVNGPDGRPWHSWRVLILPYLEEKETYNAYNFNEPWDGPNNRKLAERMPKQYAFHGFEKPGNTTTNYLAVVGADTLWPGTKKVTQKDVKDGTGVTIAVVENRGADVHWMEPRDLALDKMSMQINSPNGIGSPYVEPGVLMASGSLSSLPPDIKPQVLRAMFTIAGGEQLDVNDSGGWKVMEDGRKRALRESQ